MAVAAEDRADHAGVALAPRIGAQLIDVLLPPRDLRRAVALVGEGGEDQPVDALGLRLRVRRRRGCRRTTCRKNASFAGRSPARRRATAASRSSTPLAMSELFAGTAGMAIAVMVHGPHVVAVTGEHIHQRIFALAGHGQVVAASAPTFDEPCTRNSTGSGGSPAAGAPRRFRHMLSFTSPFWPNIRWLQILAGRGAPACACAGAMPETRPGADAETRARDQGASCDGMIGHDALPMRFNGRLSSKPRMGSFPAGARIAVRTASAGGVWPNIAQRRTIKRMLPPSRRHTTSASGAGSRWRPIPTSPALRHMERRNQGMPANASCQCGLGFEVATRAFRLFVGNSNPPYK